MNVLTSDLNDEQVNRLLTATVSPRPIAWITTLSKDGRPNLAPFSAFAPICNSPPLIAFSAGRKTDGAPKDTLLNVLSTREFVINVVEEPLVRQMVRTAQELTGDADEISHAGLTCTPSLLIKPPRIAGCRVGLECRLFRHVDLGTTDLMLGEVLCVWVDDAIADHEQNPTIEKGYAPIGALAIDHYVVCCPPAVRMIPFDDLGT